MKAGFACKTLDEFLDQWGAELGAEVDKSMAPLHIPTRDTPELLPLHRKPYPGQAHCIAANVKLLNRQNNVGLICEPGSGKTLMAAAICHNHANTAQPKRWHKKNPAAAPKGLKPVAVASYRALIMCPGHLPKKWKREIERTIPRANVTILESFADVVLLTKAPPPDGPEWFIISKDRAKLSCGWEAAYINRGKFGRPGLRCPSCDAIQLDQRRQTATKEYMERDRRACHQCGDRLWQDVPKPRRYSPALFIKKQMHRFFDYLVVDESHDMKGADTVQADAMGFLSAAAKKTLTLTGTLVGGYAWHVRTTLFRVGAAASLVEQGLGWKDEQAFNERYGRIETTVISTNSTDAHGNRLARGNKRKVIKKVKPGIMPTLFGDHLISTNTFLSLDEVCADLPSFHETLVPVDIDDDILKEYARVEGVMRDAIKAMMFQPGSRSLLGKLLHTLLAYPDYPFDWKEIGYHTEDAESGDEIWVPVVTPQSFSRNRLYAKEQALIHHIKQELAEGRKCWVFTTMVGERDAIGRLEELLRAEGITAKTLRSSVEPIAREDWIEREGPRCDVILSMPELVKTGLDFFDLHGRYNFPSIMFYMTGYNSFTLSQASRRAWRIGQTQPCRVYYFFAKETMQAIAMELMAKKMSATSAVSGRFSTEGLAAMAGEDDSMEMAMAKALVEKTASTAGALRAWEKVIGVQEAERGVVPATGIDEIVKKAMAKPLPAEKQTTTKPAVMPPPVRPVFDEHHTDLFALLDFADLSEVPL